MYVTDVMQHHLPIICQVATKPAKITTTLMCVTDPQSPKKSPTEQAGVCTVAVLLVSISRAESRPQLAQPSENNGDKAGMQKLIVWAQTGITLSTL